MLKVPRLGVSLFCCQLFTWCIEVKRWLSVNPLREIKFPSESPHRERVISDEEIEILLPFLSTEMRYIF